MISFYVAKREFSKETKRGIDSAKEVQKPSYFEWKTSAAFNKKGYRNGILPYHHELSLQTKFFCVGSVSYTHLDVYKRQAFKLYSKQPSRNGRTLKDKASDL